MEKISQWLSGMSGHSALDVEIAKKDFVKKTGKPWPKYLKGEPVKQLLAEGRKNYKGLQVWQGSSTAHVAAGWQVASAMCHQYLPDFWPVSMGRGSMFAEYVDALEKAGY